MDGVCAIKPEYLLAVEPPSKKLKLDDGVDAAIAADAPEADEAPHNKIAASGGGDGADADQPNWKQSKRARGQNKSRKATIFRLPRTAGLCKSFMNGPEPEQPCAYDKCKYMHDVSAYLIAKGADIGQTCHIYSTRGFCVRGVTCRFAGGHLDAALKNLRNEELWDATKWDLETVNSISNGELGGGLFIYNYLYLYTCVLQSCKTSYARKRSTLPTPKPPSSWQTS